MATFADIENEIDNVLSSISQDMTEDEQAAFDAYLDELGIAESDKIDGAAYMFKAMDAREEFFNERIAEFTAKKRAVVNAKARMKMHYLQVMEASGLNKVQGSAYTLYRRMTPAVEVTNMDKLPEQYVRITVSKDADKKALMAALKSGQFIDGAELKQNVSLQVR